MRNAEPDAAGPDAGGATGISAVAIIPARIGSTRLPRKMLLAETGTPLFVHTARAVAACPAIARVVVATDDDEIMAAAREHDVEALMTSPAHQSGTDRVREALQALERVSADRHDVVLNVQGDEPDVAPEDLSALVASFADRAVEMATLWVPIEDPADLASSSVVKLVLAANGDALYFSRAPIPDAGHARAGAETPPARRHIGVYAFRPAALARFCALPPSALECTENLEQLRWLEAGERLRVLPASRCPRGIDTAQDYADFVHRSSPSSDSQSPDSHSART